MMSLEDGKTVSVDYVGRLEDGSVFDSSVERGQPLEFELGSGQVIPGFERAVREMSVGQKKNITLGPDEAYGVENPDLLQDMPRDKAPADVKPGMQGFAQSEDGREIPLTVVRVEDDFVTVDLNHPLAGKTLNFEVTLRDVR
jgi:peptidylprolyl isomerase